MALKYKTLSMTSIFWLFLAGLIYGQGASDVLRYSLEYPTSDPVSMVMPGVTNATGFGAYQENPAAMALFKESFFSFSLSTRFVDETTDFLGNEVSFDDNQTNVGDIGLVYKVPTARGTLVVGGGYSQSTDYNRAFSGSGRNSRSTITDFYNITADDSLFFAAFDVFAIDFATTDSSFSETASIFRIGFSEFPGINQDFEVTETGVLGDVSAFIATEFQKNFFIGASIGFLNGSYTFKRSFLESDRRGDFEADFIDTDGDGAGDTDIDNILSEDRIDADLSAFSARFGLIYETGKFRIGGGYHFNNKISVDEEFNTEITTTFDNGVQFFDDAPGIFSYKVSRPDRINLGITLKDISGFTISASAESVRYSNGRIEFDNLDLNPVEADINNTVSSNLEDVFNIKGGIEYKLNRIFTPRAGFAYFPSPQKNVDASRRFVSGGFSAQIFDQITFDLGIQYSAWDDVNQLYEFFDGNQIAAETVQEDVTRWNVLGGVKIGFN